MILDTALKISGNVLWVYRNGIRMGAQKNLQGSTYFCTFFANSQIFSLNCQIAIQKFIDYYPAFEVSSECKFLKASFIFAIFEAIDLDWMSAVILYGVGRVHLNDCSVF